MFVSVIRFFVNNWIYELYIKPSYYFKYYGFEWIKPLSANGMYLVFVILALCYLLILLGFFYRIAIVAAFILFTYIELLDKSNYLNHYYFISLISFLLIFIPAHKSFSIDTFRKPSLKSDFVPQWTIIALKLQIAIVYVFAGIAKLNYDWLFNAMPLKIWLPANNHLPIIGALMDQVWVAYFFSWFGAIYDLFIVYFLINKKTRLIAFVFVFLFHILTKILFPIGMFPYIMILGSLIYFSDEFHLKIIGILKKIFPFKVRTSNKSEISTSNVFNSISLTIFAIFFSFQFLLPWRFLAYPGKLFWTEQGYRFSWRVMLMEKAGTAFFYVKDKKSGKEIEIMNSDYLSKNQEKMMATQPDMLLQFAQMLKMDYEKKGFKNPEIRVESYVTLNGSGSRLFVNSTIDLSQEKESFLPKNWILPYQN